MDWSWSVLYFLVFLQLATGIALLRSRLEPRRALQLLATLFIFNATLTALLTLPIAGTIYLRSDPGWVTRLVRAIDAPTGPLLLAFLAARSSRSWARPFSSVLVWIGVAQGLIELALPIYANEYDTYTRALPYYAAVGGGALVLAGGALWERWIALALLARGWYWATGGMFSLFQDGLGPEPVVVVNRLALVALAALCLAASFRLGARGVGRDRAVVVPVLLIGPGVAILELGFAASLPPGTEFRAGSVLILNLVTLALVRPLIVIQGLLPESMGAKLLRTSIVSVLALLAAGLVSIGLLAGVEVGPMMEQTMEYSFGLLVGLLALALMEARSSPRNTEADEGADPGPDPTPETVAVQAPERGRPQWQTLLLELRGSSHVGDASAPVDDRLTQRAIVERTGMRAARVSALVTDLNETAATRLDLYTPGWRGDAEAPPGLLLVRSYRGNVPGRPGVWLYYRLTPHGERLAEAIGTPPPAAAHAVSG